MARRATSLGPKPSLFVFFVCFLLVFFFFFLVHFLSLFLIEKPCFPPQKRAFFVFFLGVSLSFSLAFFRLPLFHFLFLCLSVFLFFLPSFLSFFFASFLFLVLVSFSFFFLLCFCFLKRTTSKYSIRKFFFIHPFSFLLVSSLLFSYKFPFLIFAFFLILSFVFCSTSVFGFKECKFKKTHFFKKRGVAQHNGFFLWTCVLQNVKSYRFFLGIFWLFFKKHYKNRHFSTLFEATNYKKMAFLEVIIWSSWKLLSGPSWLRLKKRQLGPDNNFQNFCAQFFFPKKRAETPIFIVFLAIGVLEKKTNLDQIITSKRAKLGPDNNSTAYIYIYTLKTGPSISSKLVQVCCAT